MCSLRSLSNIPLFLNPSNSLWMFLSRPFCHAVFVCVTCSLLVTGRRPSKIINISPLLLGKFDKSSNDSSPTTTTTTPTNITDNHYDYNTITRTGTTTTTPTTCTTTATTTNENSPTCSTATTATTTTRSPPYVPCSPVKEVWKEPRPKSST